MTELTAKQVSSLKQQMIELKQQLHQLLESVHDRAEPVKLDQQAVGRVSRIDAITQQQMAKANESQAQQRLVALDAALDRIEQKDYGYCDECGCNVIFARLQIKPEAQFCISCQSKME